MSIWDTYPANYRENEVRQILAAVRAGECVSILGLSGAGKSNLLAFIAHREDAFPHPTALVDCNRLSETTPEGLFHLMRRSIGDSETASDELAALGSSIQRRLEEGPSSLSILLDRFDALTELSNPQLSSNLRSLRDDFKYKLTFVTATRRPLDKLNEFAELFYAHTIWVGSLSESDVRWNITRYAQRTGQIWDEEVVQAMIQFSWGYPSLLRGICEAHAAGASLEMPELAYHPAVQRRIGEFWADSPSEEALEKSGIANQPLLLTGRSVEEVDNAKLTAKEHLLLRYLREHPNQVCDKDELVAAIWPEDQIYERGIRDDSLAQLVRRLRVKIEPDPSKPRRVHTVPGRGYRYTP
jgi:DNA-binding winged helix-turn-helix (wHTH) protein